MANTGELPSIGICIESNSNSWLNVYCKWNLRMCNLSRTLTLNKTLPMAISRNAETLWPEGPAGSVTSVPVPGSSAEAPDGVENTGLLQGLHQSTFPLQYGHALACIPRSLSKKCRRKKCSARHLPASSGSRSQLGLD